MEYLIGIDLGSTNLKAMIYDLRGRCVASASAPSQLLHPDPEHPDWATWDPDYIWTTIGELLKRAIAELDSPDSIRAVAVTGLGMDGVPVAADGSILYPFISWHCPRTVPQYERWLEQVGADRQFALTGNPVWPFNTLFRLQWMMEHEPEILERAEKWLVIEDFLNYELCGEYATDYSMASSTLILDQRTRQWSDEIIGLAGIDGSLLSKPQPSSTIIGEVHAQAAVATGIPQGTPVVLGGHDFLCGALATGAFRPGVISDVMGTWEIIVAALEQPVLTPEVQAMGVWVDSHVARDQWAAMASTVAGDALEWFRREYAPGVDWDALVALAKASPVGAGGVMFLPHMSGSFAPTVDPQSMGAFVGLRNTASKGDMLRAIIEGLNYQFLQLANAFGSALSVQPESVIAIGGPTRNAVWMQSKADVLGKPVEVPELDEAVPLGAAMLAGIGVGLYADEADAFSHVYRAGRTYEPNAEAHARYQECFAVFETLYPALKAVHHQLSGAQK